MNNAVFLSGSITINKLPKCVMDSLNAIIKNNFPILVGDASGIDLLVQQYLKDKQYYNVTIYSIYNPPRNKATLKFSTKVVNIEKAGNDKVLNKERERQTKKDEEMTKDSTYSLVVWDGISRGSYNNILRALSLNKKVKVYLSERDEYLKVVNEEEIKYIYSSNNGYTASEVVEYLLNEGYEVFKNTRELNKYLVKEGIIKKEDNIYVSLRNKEMFLDSDYKGKSTGVKFNDKFIDWIEKEIKSQTQSSLLL